MTKNNKHPDKLVEYESDVDISEAQKKHFSKLGYKPYMSNQGKIKWLTFEQQLYQRLKHVKKSPFPRKHKYLPQKRKRARRRFTLARMLLDNWVLVLIGFLILFIVTYYDKLVNIVTKLFF
jgi:hypothetical protein